MPEDSKPGDIAWKSCKTVPISFCEGPLISGGKGHTYIISHMAQMQWGVVGNVILIASERDSAFTFLGTSC